MTRRKPGLIPAIYIYIVYTHSSYSPDSLPPDISPDHSNQLTKTIFSYFFVLPTTGPVRWQTIECHCVHVQSGGHRWSIVSAIVAQGKRFIFRAHTACADVAGE